MSHQGQENQGTGLRDVFDILVKTPLERLQSLTIQLGESDEDTIIHGLCLVVLQRNVKALEKFKMLKDNCLANHLAEKLQIGGNLEDFGNYCGNFHELTIETLAVFARIFKSLSEQRLCDPLLRNLAYQRALSTDSHKTSGEEQEYYQLIEEAKGVCGPQIAEQMCSQKELKPGSYCDSQRSLKEGNLTLTVTRCQDESGRVHSFPSPLQANSSEPSYPTHLEISSPPTILFREDSNIPETPDDAKLNSPVIAGECKEKQVHGQSKINESALSEIKDSKMDATIAAVCRKPDSPSSHSGATKPCTQPKILYPSGTNIFLPKMPVPSEIHESKGAEEEEEEEAVFYPFVILHAPEEEDMAESIKQKLEKVIGTEGAIFCDEFAIPGKSTLRCVEDAINNSAFTILLLTCNFNTRMLEIETNSALINSINTTHKYNTVIPLLPRENTMPRENIPIALQTIVPLEENRNFEKKIKKALNPAKIKQLKKIWVEDQSLKRQIERQDRLKRQKIQEFKMAQLLEKEKLNLLMARHLAVNCTEQHGSDSQAGWQQVRNIHIENAQYIMIGNDSQMTVDSSGGPDKNNPNSQEKEQ
ncbi:TIR domain-containing adapter molecule 2 [Channa argus]|uniref:TIR domain-containing adapter molecule 2 n=1 Tax=Channa argus TaxID=215402 RepID=A0A6G1QAH7_CHAAH|nr:TIR domain-containing adapter molecule 2 [Channa argus]KAK2895358.1 hypothetical protein Q8A73_014846 [Channa argus]